ncbi:pentatricopeptide repeat-containing protein At1g30610, chloroplastic-like [Coffea arabica]|uniref:Pentatricopeptide repeat-containing protein At1g30610, chloroplastic-like n=1 Tax=Coffea arabica TaxID=13443 RepID=A0A6P6U5R3_COFAR
MAQVGLPLTESSLVFGPNYIQNSIFPSGFPVSQRPFFGIALKFQLHKVKKQSTRIITGSLLANKNVVDEKEFQFKPSFDEYLKAMESVKASREKQGPQNSRKDGNSKGKRANQNDTLKDSDRKDNSFSKGDEEDGELRGIGGEVSSVFMGKEGKDDRFSNTVKVKKKNVELKKTRKPMKKSFTSGENDSIESEALHIIDRAAFKPLEQLDDVYDKPRITRVDMEERIQKLAKCLNGADIDMPEWMFSKMMRSAKIRFSDHSVLRIIQILGKLGNWRRVLQVIEWIQLRERFKSHKLRFIYTTALNVLGKSRRPVEALNLFQSMQQQMCTYPDLVAYRCIAVTLGQAGHMKELFHVIDCMRSLPKKKFKTGFLQKWDPRLEPDVVVYNAVLNACVKRKNWEGAFWVLQQLKQQGQPPSSTTYGLVMEVMLACGKYNLVHDFFRKMQKTCIPNSLTYKVLLNTLWREGKIDEAILAIEEMERRGIIGTASLYYDLARCLCSAQRCQEALMQIDKLCRVANKPLVVTFTGLIQACVDSGDAKNGAYIFEHMQKFCSPNLVTYNIMLKAFLNQGMFEEAKQLFLRLLENSHNINSKSDYKEKVTPDLYTFNTMLEGCAAEEKWDDLEWVYVEMLKSGYHFNSKRHLQIILDASSAGKGELLEMVWMHLVQGDQIPPFLLISQMFRIKLEQRNFTAALSCFACHPSINSQAFSTKWWLKFFADNVHSLEKDTFVKLMHSANSLVARTDAQNLILQNLKLSCMEFLSQQMASNELSLTEVADRTHCTSTTAFVY